MIKNLAIGEVDDKLLPVEIGTMAWSPKMDLLSVANVQGEVILYRLSWQKVWTLEAQGEGVKVTCLFWRPDGKSLAIGYTNSLLLICDTEDKEILTNHVLKDPAQLLQWVSITETYSKENLNTIFKDDADDFLPPLLSLNKGFSESSIGTSRDKLAGEGSKDSKKVDNQSNLNLLCCVTNSGFVYFYAFGICSCLEYNFKSSCALSPAFKFHTASICSDYSLLSVVFENEPGNLQWVLLNLPVFNTRNQELHVLAAKQVILTSHFNYLASTIRSITESWEEILVEIDAKLAKYAAEKKRSGNETVSDDFLELLMFGYPTKELQKFLLHDLSEKGLKKLGHSIELTYSNIQKLVLKHVQPVGLAIFYHLIDLSSMAMSGENFAQLGISPDKCDSCLRTAGSFMLKATELQQVIDYSMINFKAFFRWLYGAILRLSDEPIPSEIAKSSEQDINIVAQYLKDHFSLIPSGAEDERFCFNLERVGQYLKNEDLTIIQDQTNNPWVRFLEAHPSLKNDTLLFPYKVEKSLVQQYLNLQKEFDETCQQIASHNGQSLSPSCSLNLPTRKGVAPGKVLHKFNNIYNHQFMYVSESIPCEHLNFLHIESSSNNISSKMVCRNKAVQVFFEETPTDDLSRPLKIQDYQFYNDDTISVLLVKSSPESNEIPVLAQIPIKEFLKHVEFATELPENSDTLMRVNGWSCVSDGSGTIYRLPGVIPYRVEVSGTRHVACVTFVSKRRVRLIEMDVEDEEEEEEIEEVSGNPPEEMDNATNSSKDSSNSFSGLDCSERMEESDENKENFRDSSLND